MIVSATRMLKLLGDVKDFLNDAVDHGNYHFIVYRFGHGLCSGRLSILPVLVVRRRAAH